MKRKPLHNPPREIREAEAMPPHSRCAERNKILRRDTHRWTRADTEALRKLSDLHRPGRG